MKNKKNQWRYLFVGYWAISFILLIGSRIASHTRLDLTMYLLFSVISLVTALVPCIGGFYKKQLFFIAYTFMQVIAMVYMYVVIVGNLTPGWSDITSLINYFVLTIIGLLLGTFGEVLAYLFVKKRNTK